MTHAPPEMGKTPMDPIARGGGAEVESEPLTDLSARSPKPWERLTRVVEVARGFTSQVVKKAEADNIFFLAGAISFNVLVAIIPLILAVLGIAGMILRIRSTDPTEALLLYITKSLPPIGEEFTLRIRDVLRQLIDQSTGLLSIGMVFLIWFSTRLIGTLRTALREIFDIQEDRGIVAGKIFDIKMVFAAGTLLVVNVALTLVLDLIVRYGIRILGLNPDQIQAFQIFYSQALAFVVIWLMFFLIYRYLPARKTLWRTAILAATFTAVLFEVMKHVFGWYVTSIANYSSTYGSLSILIILFLWIYYTAIAFILGGEVAQVVATRRIRRRQEERLQ
jgi:membrane protein